MMDVELYKKAAKPVIPNEGTKGGQELIVNEIIACFNLCSHMWIPFPNNCCLYNLLKHMGYDTHCYSIGENVQDRDGLYFGTPTIVNGKRLFPKSEYNEEMGMYNKKTEREYVRHLCKIAEDNNFKTIVTGLGSGDISPEERLEDMGGGEMVTMKKFNGFTDWVFRRDI